MPITSDFTHNNSQENNRCPNNGEYSRQLHKRLSDFGPVFFFNEIQLGRRKHDQQSEEGRDRVNKRAPQSDRKIQYCKAYKYQRHQALEMRTA